MKRNSLRLQVTILILFFSSLALFLKGQLINYAKKQKIIFGRLKTETISEIIIYQNKNSQALYKKNSSDDWYLKQNGVEYLAESNRVNQIIGDILGLEKGEVVSTNKNRRKEFGIGTQGIIIKTNEKQQYKIEIGKDNGLSRVYIQIYPSNEVFTTSAFTNLFFPPDYRDLNTHFVKDENAVTSIEINFNGKTIQLTKKNGDWWNEQNKAKKNRVDFYLNDLKTLKGKDISKDTLPPQSPDLIISIAEAGQKKQISFYKKNDQNYSALINNSVFKYQIAAADVASFKKTLADFTQ